MPRQGHRGRDGDDRARLRARTAAALARARLAVRAAGRACVSPSRPGVLALALRLALEWLYLYDGGERRPARPPLFHVLRGRTAVQIGGVFHSFAQSFVRAHTAVSSLCGSIYQINFLKRPGHLFKGGRVQGQSRAGLKAYGPYASACGRMRAHAKYGIMGRGPNGAPSPLFRAPRDRAAKERQRGRERGARNHPPQ